MVSLCDAQFSIMLGEENNVQYWFAILPGISTTDVKNISQCMTSKEVIIANNENKNIKFVATYDKQYEDLPRLVILFLDSCFVPNNIRIQFTISHEPHLILTSLLQSPTTGAEKAEGVEKAERAEEADDDSEFLKKLIRLVHDFIENKKTVAKTVLISPEKVEVKEVVIHTNCIDMLKVALYRVMNIIGTTGDFDVQLIPYI